MNHRLHPALLIALVLLLCAGFIFGVAWWRGRRALSVPVLLARLPAQPGMILSVNFNALRQNGALAALAGTAVAEEPEYKAFVQETGFDYQQDLDLALVWFGNNSTSMLLRGRFDWSRLTAYAVAQGGVCRNSFCRMDGSSQQRKISFFPLERDTMALAVSSDAWAASGLSQVKPARRGMQVPEQPVWLLIPPAVLRDSERFPAGTRLFAKAMESTENLLLSLSLGPERMELHLDATCRSSEEASVLAFQLQGVTRLLKELISSQNSAPNPRDLSGLLASGTFASSDRQVTGRWPVERVFLESLLQGAK